MVPDEQASIPPNMFKSVVLPAPEGPTTTTSSPRSMSKVMPSTAATSTSPMRYTLSTSRNSTNAMSPFFRQPEYRFPSPYTNPHPNASDNTPALRTNSTDPINGSQLAGCNAQVMAKVRDFLFFQSPYDLKAASHGISLLERYLDGLRPGNTNPSRSPSLQEQSVISLFFRKARHE